MSEDNETDERSQEQIAIRRKTMREWNANLKAENERLKPVRNALRWKTERDPVAYEKQKADQRAEYAAKVEAEQDREVRAYEPVPGATDAERQTNRLRRRADEQALRRKVASREQKAAQADRKWLARLRKRKPKWTEAEVQAAFAKRLKERQNEPEPYEENPNYGKF